MKIIERLKSWLGYGICKYHTICEHYQPEGFTCNDESEACWHCGIHKDVELRGMTERLKRFDTDPAGTDHDWIDWGAL